MFHHISVAVNNPAHVSQVLAAALQGRCFPFPPNPGSFMVMIDDEFGTGIELYPADTQLVPELHEVGFLSGNAAQHFTSFHAALSVAVELGHLEQIGTCESWLVRQCDRGPFKVIEFWVENKFMLELLTPEMAKDYLQFAKPGNYEAFLNQVLVEA